MRRQSAELELPNPISTDLPDYRERSANARNRILVGVAALILFLSPVLVPCLACIPGVVALTYLITMPGVYLILRTKLATSYAEAISAGFFLGIAIFTLVTVGLSRIVPAQAVAFVLLSAAILASILTARTYRTMNLPIWFASRRDYIQTGVIVLTLAFMVLLGLSDLTGIVDDDHFLHFPIIKRVALGDIPPHVPYFSDILLQGHIARDLLVGTIARFFHLKPDLAIVYTTFAMFPAFILMFYSLAARMAGGRRLETLFCFLGLLFLTSGAVGGWEIRAGCITFIWNNNVVASGYAAYIAWLICVIARDLKASNRRDFFGELSRNKLILAIASVSLTSLYFVYVSNFLLFALLIPLLPVYTAVATGRNPWRLVLHVGTIITTIFVGMLVLHSVVSNSLMERILVSIGLSHPDAPMLLAQQQRLSFKSHPFEILDGIPFLSQSSLSSQSISFYLGLSGLLVGCLVRHHALAICSLFGWITMLWLLLIDMGQYGHEYPRLMLSAHIAFGGATGLLLGTAIRRIFLLLDTLKTSSRPNGFPVLNGPCLSMIKGLLVFLACGFVLWMGKGNIEKFAQKKPWRISASLASMEKLYNMDPRNWHRHLKMHQVDYEAIRALEARVTDHKQRVLVKLTQDPTLRDATGHSMAMEENVATISGAAITGITLSHAPGAIDATYIASDYRASLFWVCPSRDLLDQLAVDWLLIDPSLLSAGVLERIKDIQGLYVAASLKDGSGRERILLGCTSSAAALPLLPDSKGFEVASSTVNTTPFSLATAILNVKTDQAPSRIKLAMMVTDDRGSIVNRSDVPILNLIPLAKNKFRAPFSMIQPGDWNIYFVNPGTLERLHETPMKVRVASKMP